MIRDPRALQIADQALDYRGESLASFLDEACGGDAQRRSDVESLLSSIDQAEGLLPEGAESKEPLGDIEETDAHVISNLTPAIQKNHDLGDRYEIVESIGRGGMGEVFRALDNRLDREVAIKVLNQTVQHHAEMRVRFEREIKTVAGLVHPNIVTLYDIATYADTNFAVMELIEGRTLRTVIGEGLDWKSASQLARGIANALQAAHGRGVIHRDIKPENVMIDSGSRVKVLDFGLAKPVDHLNQQEITTGNATPGTVPYMSPEQTNGLPLDSSTDIFSLGTTLYEMLTGVNPFRAETVFATMQNINTKTPKVTEAAPGSPEKLRNILDEMLHRSPEQRPSASEVASVLGSLLDSHEKAQPSVIVLDKETKILEVVGEKKTTDSSTTQGGRPSIAVLPLQSYSADPSLKFLGDAIAQEIIVELARLHWLFVIARGSSFRFRDPSVDISQVGSVLGARYVLTGSVAMQGSQGVVSVELLKSGDQEIVWAEQFSVTMDDLLQLRHTITSNIVVAIENRIQISEADSAQRLGTENLDAWGAYHRGLWHMYRFNPDDNSAAAGFFNRAIQIDPRFARAYAGLSFTHFQEAFLRFSGDEQAHKDQTQSLAEKSLELDPHDPFTTLTMGRAAWLANDLDAATSWFGRSLELSPNYAFAWYNQSLTNALSNEGNQAEEGALKAMALSPIDPLSYAMYDTVALSHVVRGEYEQAIPWSVKALKEPTAHVHIWLIAAMVHQLAGQKDEASRYAATVFKKKPNYSQDHFFKAFPFSDPSTLERCKQALRELGI